MEGRGWGRETVGKRGCRVGERGVSRIVVRREASSTQPVTRLMVGVGSSETVTAGGHRRAWVGVWSLTPPGASRGWVSLPMVREELYAGSLFRPDMEG